MTGLAFWRSFHFSATTIAAGLPIVWICEEVNTKRECRHTGRNSVLPCWTVRHFCLIFILTCRRYNVTKCKHVIYISIVKLKVQIIWHKSNPTLMRLSRTKHRIRETAARANNFQSAFLSESAFDIHSVTRDDGYDGRFTFQR